MSAWYAFVKCFLVWRVKEGYAARKRTDAPIDHARGIEAYSPRMHDTKPLGPGIIVIVTIGQGSVCQVCDSHRHGVKYREISLWRFDIVLHNE